MSHMERLGKIIMLLFCVLGLPSGLVWSGWSLIGLVPADARGAIVTLIPYGIAAIIWALLVWLAVHIFSKAI